MRPAGRSTIRWAKMELRSRRSLSTTTYLLSMSGRARRRGSGDLTLNPPLEFYNIDNRVRTLGGRYRPPFAHGARAGQSRLTNLGHDSGARSRTGLSAGHRRSGALFRQGDEAAAGTARHRRRRPAVGTALSILTNSPDLTRPRNRWPIPRRNWLVNTSAPFIEDLRVTDKVSQNLHAELALRAVGPGARAMPAASSGAAKRCAPFWRKAGVGWRRLQFAGRLWAVPLESGDAGGGSGAPAPHVRVQGTRKLDFAAAGGRAGRHAGCAFHGRAGNRAHPCQNRIAVARERAFGVRRNGPGGTGWRFSILVNNLRRAGQRDPRHDGPHLYTYNGIAYADLRISLPGLRDQV